MLWGCQRYLYKGVDEGYMQYFRIHVSISWKVRGWIWLNSSEIRARG